MKLLTMILLALGLAMDAFAVSVSNGLCYRQLTAPKMLMIPLFFGVFQGVMPLLGCFAGGALSAAVMKWDHWIAFGLLAFIGGRMIHDTLREKSRPAECRSAEFTLRTLLMQSVATSIDALAVGVSFAMVRVNAPLASAVIAAVTFLCSLVGVLAGKRFGDAISGKAEIAGGVLLIGIGLEMLLEHLI